MTEQEIATLVAQSVKAALQEYIGAPAAPAVSQPAAKRTVLVKKGGKESTASGTVTGFKTLSDTALDEYLTTVYICRSKEDGLFFYGACGPLWGIMFRRVYWQREKPLSPEQCSWFKETLDKHPENLTVLHERYPALKADLKRKGLTAWSILDAKEADRKAARQSRKALLA